MYRVVCIKKIEKPKTIPIVNVFHERIMSKSVLHFINETILLSNSIEGRYLCNLLCHIYLFFPFNFI